VSRIIGGVVGSLRLKGPAKATRPTSDRVKESVFSILESVDVVEGAAVADLFAGTGALGLEAASRGAKSVTLVEKDQAAAAICKENIALVDSGLRKSGAEVSISLKRDSAERYLKSAPQANLIFIDPPYDFSNSEISNLLEQIAMSAGAIITLERSSKSEVPEFSAKLSILREANYGDTVVYFLTTGDAQ
jgi:16S rRNA (guanine966-N2)-methyltransferase